MFDSKIDHSKVRHRWILHLFLSCMSVCTFLLLLAFSTYLSCFTLSFRLPPFCLSPCPYVYVIFLSLTYLLSTHWYVIFYSIMICLLYIFLSPVVFLSLCLYLSISLIFLSSFYCYLFDIYRWLFCLLSANPTFYY